MKLNSKGFGVVEGLLIVIIVGLICGAGYYVYKANKNTNESLHNTGNSEAIRSEAQEETDMDPTVGWKTYTSSNPKFSFKYPSEWNVVEENGVLSVRTPDFKLKSTEFCPAIASGYEFTVSFDSEPASKDVVSQTLAEGNTTFVENPKPSSLGDIAAVRYSSTPGECGWRETTTTYHQGYVYHVYGSLYQELGQYSDEYDLVIGSFVFE